MYSSIKCAVQWSKHCGLPKVIANAEHVFVNQSNDMALFQKSNEERKERPFIPGAGDEMASGGEDCARGTIGDWTNHSEDHESLLELGTSMPSAVAKLI